MLARCSQPWPGLPWALAQWLGLGKPRGDVVGWREYFRRWRHIIPWWLMRRWRRIGLIAVFLANEGARVGTHWKDTYDFSAQMSNGFFALPATQIYHVAITLLVILLVLGEER